MDLTMNTDLEQARRELLGEPPSTDSTVTYSVRYCEDDLGEVVASDERHNDNENISDSGDESSSHPPGIVQVEECSFKSSGRVQGAADHLTEARRNLSDLFWLGQSSVPYAYERFWDRWDMDTGKLARPQPAPCPIRKNPMSKEDREEHKEYRRRAQRKANLRKRKYIMATWKRQREERDAAAAALEAEHAYVHANHVASMANGGVSVDAAQETKGPAHSEEAAEEPEATDYENDWPLYNGMTDNGPSCSGGPSGDLPECSGNSSHTEEDAENFVPFSYHIHWPTDGGDSSHEDADDSDEGAVDHVARAIAIEWAAHRHSTLAEREEYQSDSDDSDDDVGWEMISYPAVDEKSLDVEEVTVAEVGDAADIDLARPSIRVDQQPNDAESLETESQ